MAGAHDVRADSEPHRVEITSYEGFTHPNWDPNTLENDIALVRLPEKIQFNDYIRPACLPPTEDESNGYVGDLTTPVGWVRMLTVLEESHLNCRWLKISLSSTILLAIVFTALCVLTLPMARVCAMVTVVVL